MRIFAAFNQVGPECPICMSKKETETVLVPIPGTEKDRICEARQVHRKCYDLFLEMSDLPKEVYDE